MLSRSHHPSVHTPFVAAELPLAEVPDSSSQYAAQTSPKPSLSRSSLILRARLSARLSARKARTSSGAGGSPTASIDTLRRNSASPERAEGNTWIAFSLL